MNTTNYQNAFIRIAADSPVQEAQVPPVKSSGPTVANLQYEMLQDHPYRYTSDDVVFGVYASKQEISAADRTEAREAFFAKGQPCMRASPLTKRYGWGIHSDDDGRIALVPAGTSEYQDLAARKDLRQLDAMRSKRA